MTSRRYLTHKLHPIEQNPNSERGDTETYPDHAVRAGCPRLRADHCQRRPGETLEEIRRIQHRRGVGHACRELQFPAESRGDELRPVDGAHRGRQYQCLCQCASGLTRPALPLKIAEWSKDTQKVEIDKETAIPFLKDSFDFCNQAVAAMTPARMDTVVGPPARNLTGFEWLWAYFTHTAHHRRHAEVYLRVKGIKPPDYQV